MYIYCNLGPKTWPANLGGYNGKGDWFYFSEILKIDFTFQKDDDSQQSLFRTVLLYLSGACTEIGDTL